MFKEILLFLFNYIAIPTVVTTVTIFLLKKFMGEKIDHYFNERITLFKHQLDLTTEAERFNYQKKIQQFSLYTVKKHENYINLYELILLTVSRILNLQGFRTVLTYEEYNEDDLRELMTSKKFPKGKIEEVMNLLKFGEREEAIKLMRSFLRLIEVTEASNSFWELKNQVMRARLYLTDILDSKLDYFLTSIGSLLSVYETLERIPFEDRDEKLLLIKEGAENRKTIRPLTEELTDLLKKELSFGNH